MSSYFAAANSDRGFVSRFDRIFGGVSRLYVILGGPGTGKSHLLRMLGRAAEDKGYACEYFYCSSDPSSLDGVLIPELDCAMIDGTAPHTWEMKCPGVIEQIINLGEFWDADRLTAVKDEVLRLAALKKSDYTAAYKLLASACEFESEIDRIGSEALLTDKLNGAVSRLSRTWSKDAHGTENLRISTAVSSKGRVTLDIPGIKAPKRIAVTGPRFAVRKIMNSLYDAAVSGCVPRTVSCEVPFTDSIETLYLTADGIMFTSCADADATDTLNAWRFIDRDILRRHRGKIRFYERCRNSLTDAAVDRLKCAGERHAEIERLYSGAMDFNAKEKYCKKLVGKIISEK